MVIHNSPNLRPDIEQPEDRRRHLVALARYPVRQTVYTDPRRAARVLRNLIAAAVIVGAAVLSFTFGYAVLQVLVRGLLVVLLVGLVALIVVLVVDLLRGPSA